MEVYSIIVGASTIQWCCSKVTVEDLRDKRFMVLMMDLSSVVNLIFGKIVSFLQYTFKFSILDIFIVSGCSFITIAQLSYDYVSSILIDYRVTVIFRKSYSILLNSF